MNISQWKVGDRTFFSLEVDDRLLLTHNNTALHLDNPTNIPYSQYKYSSTGVTRTIDLHIDLSDLAIFWMIQIESDPGLIECNTHIPSYSTS